MFLNLSISILTKEPPDHSFYSSQKNSTIKLSLFSHGWPLAHLVTEVEQCAVWHQVVFLLLCQQRPENSPVINNAINSLCLALQCMSDWEGDGEQCGVQATTIMTGTRALTQTAGAEGHWSPFTGRLPPQSGRQPVWYCQHKTETKGLGQPDVQMY